MTRSARWNIYAVLVANFVGHASALRTKQLFLNKIASFLQESC